MKKNLSVLVALLMSVSINAQVQTPERDNTPSGGYGGPVFKVGTFNGKTGLLSGGRGAWILNHQVAIGGGSYSLSSDIKLDKLSSNENPLYMNLSYQGFEIEYIHNSEKMVNWTVHTMIGGGSVRLLEHNPDVSIDKDMISIIEPGINIDINVCNWFRIGIGASYRIASGLDMTELSNFDINGFAGTVILKFGRF
ncbi:MAG: hypothetical protein EPN88_12210 [Bacteroidetes bacterium]|nr:MAG: hypothetical protein EPN88_12210 [Bacteroidota bacterium]